MYRLMLVLLAAVALSSFGQISPEEAMERLKERQKQRGDQPAATRPAYTKPVAKKKVLKLKPGAPETVVNWFNALPVFKGQLIQSINDEIDNREQRIKQMNNMALPLRRVGQNIQGVPEMRPDNSVAVARSNAIRQLRNEILVLKKKITQIKEDESFIYVPPFDFKVGGFGQVDDLVFKVSQVIDHNNLIATMGDRRVWMKGFDTGDKVDGDHFTYKGVVVCTKSKSYTSVLGANQTVLLVEPLDYEPWVEVVEEIVPPKP